MATQLPHWGDDGYPIHEEKRKPIEMKPGTRRLLYLLVLMAVVVAFALTFEPWWLRYVFSMLAILIASFMIWRTKVHPDLQSS